MTKDDKGRARFFRRFFESRTLAVNPVDSLEIIHVGQEDGASNDVIERRAGGFENRAHVLHDLRRLFLDGFADQLHLSRETDLSGHVHRVSNLNRVTTVSMGVVVFEGTLAFAVVVVVAYLDGLVVRTERRRSLIGGDDLLRHGADSRRATVRRGATGGRRGDAEGLSRGGERESGHGVCV